MAGPSSVIERRPVHRLIACAARPRRVPAAMPEAGLMPDEDLAGADTVSGAPGGGLVGLPVMMSLSFTAVGV